MIATYLINRLTNSVLHDKTHLEGLYNKQPTYSHLKSFGCLCFPTLKTDKDKIDPRSTPHIFIGYPFNTKGYKVLDLSTKRIHTFRDVSFYENVFPFTLCDFESDSSFSTVLLKLTTNTNMLNYTHRTFNNAYVLDHDTITNVTDANLHVPTPPIHIPDFHNTDPSLMRNSSPPTNNCILSETTNYQHHVPTLKRSTRSHKTPAYLKEYNYSLPSLQHQRSTSSSHLAFPEHHLSLTSLNHDSQQLVENISYDSESCSYE